MRTAPNSKTALEAIDLLWDMQDPKEYKVQLTELFEGWLSSHLTDGTNVNQRLTIWHCYETLNEFFDKLEAATVSKQ